MTARTRPITLNEDLTRMERTLHTIKEQAALIAKEQERLDKLADRVEHTITAARGTGDITAQAAAAVASVAEEDLPARIRVIIESEGPASVAELAERLRVPAARVQRAVKKLRSSDKLRNAGTPEDPRWWWAVGDEGSTPELKRSIELLLRHHRPMTSAELEAATGARRNRINGALVKLQVAGVPLKNLGDQQRAIWTIEPHAPARKR